MQQSQECTKNHLLTADMRSQALSFRCTRGDGGQAQARRPGGLARLWSRANSPTPRSLPAASSFLLLLNDFLSGPGSPEDSRVGVGYLIEGRCDRSRLQLEPWPLCSFLCGRKANMVYRERTPFPVRVKWPH